jgi:hypothetical protein
VGRNHVNDAARDTLATRRRTGWMPWAAGAALLAAAAAAAGLTVALVR